MTDWYELADQKLKAVIQRDGKKEKTLDEVFDKRTLLAFYKLFSRGVLSRVDFPISTGTEANIFKATTPQGNSVAVNIYRINTSTFRRLREYVESDPQFDLRHSSKSKIIFEWAKKEYSNLRLLWNAGVRVPEPIAYLNNILVMEYLGSEQKPAPLLRETNLANPSEVFDQITQDLVKAYKRANLVHSDLSSFNIMIHQGVPWLFDVAQAVSRDHPRAGEFLDRDIKNLVNYFGKLGVHVSKSIIYNKLSDKK